MIVGTGGQMAKLYELTEQLTKLYEMDFETDADLEALKELAKELEGDIAEKAENILKVKAQLDADADMYGAEIDRLSKLKKSAQGKADRLKDYLRFNLDSADMGKEGSKYQFGLFKVRFQKSPPALFVDNEAAISAEYFTTSAPVLQRAAILAKIKAGETVDGCHAEQNITMVIQ